MRTIFKRELRGFFHTPSGYVFLGVFLGLSGVMFYLQNLQSLSGELLIFFSQMTSLTMLLCPLLTMRLLCEERQKRTDQLLFTSPVSLTKIVLGKYLAAAVVMLLAILLTNVYTLIIALYGTVYPGEWFVGHLGFALQSLSFLALDLFVTCFSKNQVTAAISAFAANFLLWVLDLLVQYVEWQPLQSSLRFVSLYGRYEPFILGQLSFSSVFFFLTFIAVCLTATVHALDARRFAGGGAA